MKKLGKWLIAILVVTFILSGCSTGAPTSTDEKAKSSDTGKSAKPIKIGYIVPLTGALASNGIPQKIAIDMAVDEINKKGGINGSQIELLTEDDQMNVQQSVTLFKKLAGENIVANLGPFTGSSWDNVTGLANQLKVPAINMTAVIPKAAVLPWAVSVKSGDDYALPIVVKKFNEEVPGIKKVVVIGDTKQVAGVMGMDEFTKAAKAEGMEVLDRIEFTGGTTDFSPVVTKLKSAKPDAIFVAAQVKEAAGIAKEMERQSLNIPALGSAMMWSGGFNTVVGTAGKNWYGAGYFDSSDTAPESVAFINTFVEKTKAFKEIVQPVNIGGNALFYTTVYMLADIIQKANINGDTPVEEARTKIQEALVKADFDGVVNIKMQDGIGQIPQYLTKLNVEKQVWETVK